MRFERLHLERYGIFDGHALDLSGEGVRLHLIHGPNEGGKSTALSAICDLLFGFPQRSPYGFRHSNDRLRLGATIVAATGQSLSFKRRKGRTNTLLTPEEAALPDGALTPFLGGVDRETFERMHALDHVRLRQGGEAMRGDLARSLFEAGSGLSGLGAVIAGLEADADAIGSPERRSANKPLWSTEAAWREALDRIRRQAMKAEEWTKATGAVEEAQARLDAINRELSALGLRRSKLDRIRRVLPMLRRLDETAARLAAMDGTPDLPATAEEQWRDALKARHMAEEERDRCARTLAALEAAQADCPDPGPWSDLATEIDGLVTGLGDYRTKLADEPKLARDIAAAERSITDQLKELGLDLPEAGIEARLPPRPLVARIRERIQLRAKIDTQREAAERELAKAEETLRLRQAALARLGNPADPSLARQALDQAADGRDLGQRLTTAILRRQEAEKDLSRALGRLTRWNGDAESLARAPVPSTGAVAEQERLADARQADRARLRADLERQEEALRAAETALAGLHAAGTIPTRDAVQTARAARDAAWAVIRADHGRGDVPDPTNDAAFEAKLREADDLSDRVAVEAQRIADFARLTAEKLRAEHAAADLRRRLEALESQSTAAKEAWMALWAPSGVTPGRPPEMRDWLIAREEVLRRLDDCRKATAFAAEVANEDTVLRGHLLRAGAALGLADLGELETSALRDRVRACFQAADAAWAEVQALRKAIEACEAEVEARRRELEAVRSRVADWTHGWAEDMPLIGLTQQAGPGVAEAALAVWEGVGKTLADLAQSRRRRDGILRDLEAYRRALADLLDRLGPSFPEADRPRDPTEIVPVLARRWMEARDAATRAAEHARHLADARDALAAAGDRVLAAEAALAGFRAAHGLAPDADVPALARLAQEKSRLQALLVRERQEMLDHGDGLDETALRLEAEGIQADALAAEAATLDQELHRRQQEAQAAASDLTTAKAQLRELQTRDGIHDAAQAAAHAARDMAGHLGTWVRFKAAGLLLARAVERYRAANEHPLVRRASDLFALMAGSGDNPVVRLSIDYTDADRPTLVGIRRDESLCPVEGMSEGTRDQLYLALRIAAVERAALAGEPLPFVADDLFITSDEARTEAGLKALAALGGVTQVLLFTHHRYVVDAALTCLPAGAVRLHRLGEAVRVPEPA